MGGCIPHPTPAKSSADKSYRQVIPQSIDAVQFTGKVPEPLELSEMIDSG